MEQAIRAYTIDGAYQMRLEDKVGTIEVGKYADLCVLDTNLFAITSPEQILTTKAVLTMMNGKITHRDKRLPEEHVKSAGH